MCFNHVVMCAERGGPTRLRMLNIVRDEMICRKQNTGPWSVFVKTDERGTREKIPNRLGNCFFKGCVMNIFTPRGSFSMNGPIKVKT